MTAADVIPDVSDPLDRLDALTDTQRVARNARQIANVLDRLHDLGVECPTHEYIRSYMRTPALRWLIFDTDRHANQKERAALIIRAIGGHWDKKPGDLYSFEREYDGVSLGVTVDRVAVCERVVTGSHEVTRDVPDPDAPTVQVTETVEDVEWRCSPLLAEVES